MFGGNERRRSSNVRFKQLFHELKQQFPTIPDEVIANCIVEQAGTINVKKNSKIIEVLRATVTSRSSSEEPMGRSSSQCEASTLEHAYSVVSNIDVPEKESPKKKTTESHKTYKKSQRIVKNRTEESKETSPEYEGTEKRRERRSTLSSLLKKTSKITRGVSKSEDKSYPKKQSYTLVHKQQGKDYKGASYKEITPSSDQEESQTFPTVSSLRKQFECTTYEVVSESSSVRAKSRSNSPLRGSEMNQNVSQSSHDVNQNIQDIPSIKTSPKRPTSLALNTVKPFVGGWRNSLQPSEKCKNLPKLLNANILSDKPPRSPVYNKKIVNTKTKVSSTSTDTKDTNSPNSDNEDSAITKERNNVNTGARKKETVSTPTQTTDTLLGDTASGSVNLSFNVNCSMDVIRSPNTPRRTSNLQLTPETPWLQEATSPRSYTSVNLTLRPPSSTPQPPIDITSQNASLTYSTSSFDSQKGLQSRLQITVGPTAGSVTASRVRPNSCDFDVTDVTSATFDVPVIGSPNGGIEHRESMIVKQQARIERLRIELTDEKTRLIVLKKEVTELENKTGQSFAEVQRQELKLKIAHLRYQCRKLVQDLNDFAEPEFYNNLYRGQPLDVNGNRINARVRISNPGPRSQQDPDGPKWNCHICTFLNHPELNKCEQCEMPRFIHVSAAPGDNIHIHVTPRISSRIVRSWLL